MVESCANIEAQGMLLQRFSAQLVTVSSFPTRSAFASPPSQIIISSVSSNWLRILVASYSLLVLAISLSLDIPVRIIFPLASPDDWPVPKTSGYTAEEYLKSSNVSNKALLTENFSTVGGMLATRFALMHPENITELVLTNPIGLEDWKALGVPWISLNINWNTEHASSYASIRAYEQATYYVNTWDPAYDVWVNMLVNIYQGSESVKYAWDQALVIDMLLTQPVVYEFHLLKPTTLLLIGAMGEYKVSKPL
jgi:hypothetical protein